jgi:4'-phosphopantetheinyl transferase
MSAVEVAPGVWVACRRRAPAAPHPLDAAAAGGMPGWRAGEFLAGRAVLRALLRRVCPAAGDAGVVTGANGKPYLAGRPDVGVSVSHDGDWVAACVAPGYAVGIDVQVPGRTVGDRVLRRCAGRWYGPLRALPEPARARELAWIWTVQEACVKADGTGLSGRPWAVEVEPGTRTGTWHGWRWRSLRELPGPPTSCAWRATT